MFKNISKVFLVITIVLYAFFTLNIAANNDVLGSEKTQYINRGVWVTAFSEKKVLYSKQAVLDLIEFCGRTKINELYLQIYRADQAYYDSKISDRTKYNEILKSAGIDTFDFLLKEAQKKDIKVFAWVNVLSLAQNKKANIMAKLGNSILTRDQYLRTSIRDEDINDSDKYYLRDEQLFLEPGDPRVTEYLLSIIDEIITRYPLISGIHLDYIRYPYAVPFIPNSLFAKYGLVYGYGEENIKRFKQKTGLNPAEVVNKIDTFLLWDTWKREQVTALVERISQHMRKKSPHMLISCAVIPTPERAYSIAFQDWPNWLEKGIIDHAVLMNYTLDNDLAEETVKSALAHRARGKILAGIGVFLMKDKPEIFFEQCNIISNLGTDGVVFFSYDDINGRIFEILNNTPKK